MIDDMSSFQPRMMSVAYRMLGSVTDAEDVVQDAFLRYQTAGDVTAPEGFLIRTTTRLCIDRLRARQRRSYVGPWVPEPVDTRGQVSPFSDSLTQAFLLLLERLTPDERAAFLLRTVFDYEYTEIGEALDKTAVHARQLVSRARQRLGLQGERRFTADPAQAQDMAERFIAACRLGDIKTVESMLAANVEVHSDGGGRVSAARVVIHGRDRVARFLIGVFSRKRRDCELQFTSVNGTPGVVLSRDGAVIQVTSLTVGDEVNAVYISVNPDKLVRWSAADIQ